MEFQQFYEHYTQVRSKFDCRKLPVAVGINIDGLWRDDGVQRALQLAHTFQINETAE